ncbi:MAG: hypothetical protein ACYDEE_15590 [Ignavibacteriaceae bacterium]
MEYGIWSMEYGAWSMEDLAPDRLDTKTQIKVQYYKLACSG